MTGLHGGALLGLPLGPGAPCSRLHFSAFEHPTRKWWNGRHASLRSWCPQGREGSSPSFRTPAHSVRGAGIVRPSRAGRVVVSGSGSDKGPGVKEVRPWSRAGERYAGYRWPQSERSARGRRAPYAVDPNARAEAAVWEALLADAERVFTAPGFAERELNPVLELSEDLRRARGSALSRVKRHTWRSHLQRALSMARQLGLVASPDGFSAWLESAPDDAREALRALWGDVGLSPAEHLGLFLQARLDLLDRVVAECAQRGLPLRHRLHAAAVLRCIARDLASSSPSLSTHQIREAPILTLAQLAETLLIDHRELTKIVTLLEDRGQCVFYGPPGTGKTYVARALARFLAGTDERVTTVQLHPSYAYEDFVEGYRPSGAGRDSGFRLVDGPLKRIASAAQRDPSHGYVLLLDELNRANVAKVFGELYYLLEYRDESIRLQYSQTPFALPPNLLVIGTMNAADRSIALVDLALRRRFYFVPFFPDTPPVEGLLRRWLETHRPSHLWVADVVDRANVLLASRHDRHAAIGPSHFMRPDLTDQWVELIWEHAILPTIAEQFFGEESAVAEFHLDRLRRPDRRDRAIASPKRAERNAAPHLRRVAERRTPYRTRRDAPPDAG